MRQILFVLGIILSVNLLNQPGDPSGQVENPGTANVGIMDFLNIPVGHFTGTPSIHIPMFSVHDGNLSHGVALAYHSSGIKVHEISSPVGIGWTLVGGGAILRTIQGIADDDGYGYLDYAQTTNSTNLDPCADPPNTDGDGQPDIFRFSAGNSSGEFFFNAQGGIELMQRSNVKIVMDRVGTNQIRGFTVILPNGMRYIYGYYNGTSAVEKAEPEGLGGPQNTDIVSWFLLRIESFNQKFHIDFTYDDEIYNYRFRKIVIDNNNNGGFDDSALGPNNYVSQDIYSKRLRTISTDLQTIELVYDNTNRSDLRVNSTYASDAAKALKTIKYSTGTYCKKYELSQSYFYDPNDNNTIDLTAKYRLKLNEVQLHTCNDTLDIPSYIFDYYGPTNPDASSFLPTRFSFGRDHWGYYNGKDNNDNLYPMQSWATGDNPYCPILGDADRESDETYKVLAY